MCNSRYRLYLVCDFILRKDKYILGRIGLYFWGFGEKLNYFQGFGERSQTFLGRQGNYLQGDGEMNALFSGIKGAQTLLGASIMLNLASFFKISHATHIKYVFFNFVVHVIFFKVISCYNYHKTEHCRL